jgi:hypothetical protein
MKLRAEHDKARLDFIKNDLEVCFTFASVDPHRHHESMISPTTTAAPLP